MIEYALDLIMRNGMDGVVSSHSSIEKQVKFYNGKIEVIKEWREKSMEIFMAKGNKKISFNIDSPTKKKIKESIERNMKMLSVVASSEYHGIQDKRGYVNRKKFDKNVIESAAMIAIAEEAISKNAKAGIVFSALNEEEIANSNGVLEKDKNSMIYLSARAFYRNSSAHDVSCSRSIDGIDASISEDAYELAKKARNARKIKEGKYDVIFYPMAFANLMANVASFASAFYVEAGYSFLADKLNEKVANELLSIYDDGTLQDGIASRRFDDEGNATQRTAIIEKGVLKNYLHNSTTAFKHNAITTGNAGIVAPHPWNVVVENGSKSIDAILDNFEGIVITNVWYTRFQNYRNGDFSTVARDAIFMVEKGDMHAVKRVRVSDNMQRILNNIEALSKERKQIFWWEVETPVFTPYAVVKDVVITRP